MIEPIVEGNYYHIYNRGINRENIYRGQNDYLDFIRKYPLYLKDIVETLAYCLLKNHFHFLVYINENVIVQRKDGKGDIKLNASKQFGHFFNSYAQTFNNKYNRTGSLFESPFCRKLIAGESDLTTLIFYINTNAQLHGFVDDFKKWPFSSYHSVLKNEPTFINSQWILDWFGSKDAFIKFHDINKEFLDKRDWIVDE
jgi:REP element-mobilizing transposase RayT